jgi:hypothetical protein
MISIENAHPKNAELGNFSEAGQRLACYHISHISSKQNISPLISLGGNGSKKRQGIKMYTRIMRALNGWMGGIQFAFEA